jgi:hypothetical protein
MLPAVGSCQGNVAQDGASSGSEMGRTLYGGLSVAPRDEPSDCELAGGHGEPPLQGSHV